MTYDQIDFVADLYIPFLIVLVLYLLLKKWPLVKKADQPKLFLFIFLQLVWVYGIRYIDILFTLWPRYGLDYSTHTALSLTLVFVVVSMRKKLLGGMICLQCLYSWVMVYQKYHTYGDIISTAFIISPFVLLNIKYLSWKE